MKLNSGYGITLAFQNTKSLNMMLISVTDKLPEPSTDPTNIMLLKGLSDRCLVYENGSYYFGCYHSGLKEWILEGRKGNINVQYWMPLIKLPN